MKHSETKNDLNAFNGNYIFLLVGSLGSLAATFLVSSANITFQTKFAVFVAIVFIYLLMYAAIYVRRTKIPFDETDKIGSDTLFNAEIESKLLALEEASRFFGASLKPADIFRLAASRISEMIPFAACALYAAGEEKDNLRIAYAVGDELKKNVGLETNLRNGLAGEVFHSGKSKIDETLALDKAGVLAEALNNLNSAVAVPLLRDGNVFQVLVLYGERKNQFDDNSVQLLEAVAARIAPLFSSSQAFENSLNNALTDALTNLPNERAFFMVLENQIAESQRFPDERPLTILTMDVKNFAEHNRRFGHSAGDRLLLFVADQIKDQLRQMDFLARSMNDEFLAVLPTASEKITREIIERIERSFVVNPFVISSQEKIHLQLSFGAASFGSDGETADQLLSRALVKKTQSKFAQPENKILWFPKEYVN